MTQNGYSWPATGMMRIFINPATVPAGPVSLPARTVGAVLHEGTVLPLAPGQSPGQRAAGASGALTSRPA